MKEVHYFYAPELAGRHEVTPLSGDLERSEAGHAIRVLRLGIGDELFLADGVGCFYRAVITAVSGHRCSYRIEETLPQERAWKGHIHLAMAPTKLMDRVEWFAEKATEIGFDELSFLDCQFSERRVVKSERIDKILVSAMKQSHKAWKPQINNMQRFRDFIKQEREGDKFICHCYEESDIETGFKAGSKEHLFDVLRPGVPSTVLIGPEGDFSIDEVRLALQQGYRCVSLGSSRLRTETAALVAVHMMQLTNQIK